MPRFWDERMLDVLGAQLGAQCVYGEVVGVGGKEEEQGWVRRVVVSADYGWGCSAVQQLFPTLAEHWNLLRSLENCGCLSLTFWDGSWVWPGHWKFRKKFPR